MKRLLTAIAFLFTIVTFSQERKVPHKPPPPEKRWERDSEKIKKAITLTTDELTKIKDAFITYYKEMDALHEKNKGQRPAKEAVEKTRNKRNDAIKKFLAKDKYEKFIKVEKELGPPKPKDRPAGE